MDHLIKIIKCQAQLSGIKSPEESHTGDGQDGHGGGEGHPHPTHHQKWHLCLDHVVKAHTDGLFCILKPVEVLSQISRISQVVKV